MDFNPVAFTISLMTRDRLLHALHHKSLLALIHHT